MSRNRKPRHQPGDIFTSPETGELVRIDDDGEEEPFTPHPHEPFPIFEPDPLDHIPRRADGTVAPFYLLGQDELESLGQETPRTRRIRHDGWTVERQKDFVERLAETASWTDAARFVGLSRQSARNLYNRSPQFRAACDEALRASVGVLVETAFDRAVNGVQEQVWYQGRMVGFREKYNDRLLMFLLRVRDPLNFAPLDDLKGWQRYRAIEQNDGMIPALDRLEAAEKEWGEAKADPPALPLAGEQSVPPPLRTRSHVESSTTSPPVAPGDSGSDA